MPEPSPMRWQPRRFKSAAIVLAVGLFWLIAAWPTNWAVAILGTIPGVVLIATGAGQLLWAGDRQLCYHMALAGPVSAVLALATSALGESLGAHASGVLYLAWVCSSYASPLYMHLLGSPRRALVLALK